MPAPVNGDIAIRVLKLALDGLSLRHQVISNNIANVDTPGFRASEVSFEGQLRRLLGEDGYSPRDGTARGRLCSDGMARDMRRTNPAHLRSGTVQPTVAVLLSNAPMKNDLNNVDIDRQMVELAETTLSYSALAQLMSNKLSLLRTIINGGR